MVPAPGRQDKAVSGHRHRDGRRPGDGTGNMRKVFRFGFRLEAVHMAAFGLLYIVGIVMLVYLR